MMTPEPRLLCFSSLSGISPKNLLTKLSSCPFSSCSPGPKKNWKGLPGIFTVVRVLMLTTAGLTVSTRSAKDGSAPPGGSAAGPFLFSQPALWQKNIAATMLSRAIRDMRLTTLPIVPPVVLLWLIDKDNADIHSFKGGDC